MRISQIKIRKRYRKKIQNISRLVNSIKELGLLHAIVVNEKNELIAGKRRIEAFKKLNRKEIPSRVVNISNLLRGEYDENTVREDFLPSELGAIHKEIGEEERRGKPPNLGGFIGDTDDIVAKIGKTSHGTVDKIIAILDSNKKLMDDVDNKKISVEKAYQEVEKQKSEKKRVPLPTGTYDIILADPAWKFENEWGKGIAQEKYGTLPLEQVKQLGSKLNIAKDSACFLWVPTVLIQEGLDVLKAWSFKYHNLIVWDKVQGGGLGYWVMNQVEILLFGTKGDIKTPVERVNNLIREKKTGHSKKPEVTYNIIEKMYPRRNYLELFARQKRKNWTTWGNEV